MSLSFVITSNKIELAHLHQHYNVTMYVATLQLWLMCHPKFYFQI